jgi:LDH2 family malate/lactate/ureidoglycolate dehydrogenase
MQFSLQLEVKRRKEEPLPSGWAQDETGAETSDATRAVTKGTLLPLGGTELTSGYKGYGLAFLVELLCGVLAGKLRIIVKLELVLNIKFSGATYGPNIRRWMTTDRSANLGQCFIAVNPEMFAPGFSDRLQDLMDFMRKMEPVSAGFFILFYFIRRLAFCENLF